MGRTCPPLYGDESTEDIIFTIADIDVKINELMIKRETYVTALKEKLDKKD